MGAEKYILATKPLDVSHTAENIAEQFSEIVHEFEINGKLVAIVHDEAANMVASSRQLATQYNLESVVCAAHKLQSWRRHTLESRRPVQKLLVESRQLVSHFHHIAQATRILNDHRLMYTKGNRQLLQPLQVIQNVPA